MPGTGGPGAAGDRSHFFGGNPAGAPGSAGTSTGDGGGAGTGAASSGGISVTVADESDKRAGSVHSGKVTFPTGSGEWYKTEGGNVGFVPDVEGYQPSALEMDEFLKLLDTVLPDR